jgi:hypothetical protein
MGLVLMKLQDELMGFGLMRYMEWELCVFFLDLMGFFFLIAVGY